MPRSRKGRLFSPAELDRFLERLAATGNMVIAAEAIRRPVRSLRDRRRKDPAFAARCDVALARFRLSPDAKGSNVPDGRSRVLRTTGGEWVVIRGGRNGGAQLRRAKKGQLTDAAFALFLRTLAATANVHLSARSVGVSSTTIDYHRKRDVAFDQEVVEALKEGCARLETQLLDSALRGLRDRADDEEESLSAEVREAAAAYAPQLPAMTAYEAFVLLQKQRELLSRPTRWSPERDRQIKELGIARLEAAMRRFKL
jgi:hypothetical protein